MSGEKSKTHLAKWWIHEDPEALTLQIELENDRAVTLTCWKNGDPPAVSLWTHNGEHNFTDTSIGRGVSADSFREWIKQAARQPERKH